LSDAVLSNEQAFLDKIPLSVVEKFKLMLFMENINKYLSNYTEPKKEIEGVQPELNIRFSSLINILDDKSNTYVSYGSPGQQPASTRIPDGAIVSTATTTPSSITTPPSITTPSVSELWANITVPIEMKLSLPIHVAQSGKGNNSYRTNAKSGTQEWKRALITIEAQKNNAAEKNKFVAILSDLVNFRIFREINGKLIISESLQWGERSDVENMLEVIKLAIQKGFKFKAAAELNNDNFRRREKEILIRDVYTNQIFHVVLKNY